MLFELSSFFDYFCLFLVWVCLSCSHSSYSFMSPFLQCLIVESARNYICIVLWNGNKCFNVSMFQLVQCVVNQLSCGQTFDLRSGKFSVSNCDNPATSMCCKEAELRTDNWFTECQF